MRRKVKIHLLVENAAQIFLNGPFINFQTFCKIRFVFTNRVSNVDWPP